MIENFSAHLREGVPLTCPAEEALATSRIIQQAYDGADHPTESAG